MKNALFGIPAFLVTKMCEKCFRTGDRPRVKNRDKGYFGIVTYFIQVKAVMVLSLSLSSGRTIDNMFKEVESYIEILLNFELSYISNETCAMKGLTTTHKMFFKMLFLFGIFISWIILFLLWSLLKQVMTLKYTEQLETAKVTLIYGLVEIVKYTYLGFSSIVFYSLTCLSIEEKYIWFYDGSVECYSVWQTVMITFFLFYILPYPFLIYLGMKLLKNKRISHKSFFLGNCFPLPAVSFWMILLMRGRTAGNLQQKQSERSDGGEAIYDGFRGGFRESEKGTQYWEAVLMFRRLLISATILLPDALTQLSVCFALCLVFVFHHAYVKPFGHKGSNLSEGFSLCLLCVVAGINLMKACFVFAELNPQGSQVKILQDLELMEDMFVVLLIIFIVCQETVFTIVARAKKGILKQDWHHMLSLFGSEKGNTKENPVVADLSKSQPEEDVELETVIHDHHHDISAEKNKEDDDGEGRGQEDIPENTDEI